MGAFACPGFTGRSTGAGPRLTLFPISVSPSPGKGRPRGRDGPLGRPREEAPSMNVFQVFGDRIRSAIRGLDLGLTEADLARIAVEPPRDASHGDIATNAAMVLAKGLGLKPRDLAERIATAVAGQPDVAAAEVAGPGFINLRLADGFWGGLVKAVIDAPQTYGRGRRAGRRPTWNTSRPIRPGRCTSATAGARWWRRARQPDRLRGPAGHQGVLHQRRRRADRRARAFGVPPLPRGPRRDDRDPRGALSRRLSGAGGRGAEARPRRPPAGDGRGGVDADRQAGRDRHDDGHDPRRPRAARRHPRGVLLGGDAARSLREEPVGNR